MIRVRSARLMWCEVQESTRSQLPISEEDLVQLAAVAENDLADLFARRPQLGLLHRDCLLCIALCQGAALHYLDGRTGVKDFDVWAFFSESRRPFPSRRRVQRDFGSSKFGRTATAADRFRGRRVDLMGRSLPEPRDADPIAAVSRYLTVRQTRSAELLAQKAVVLLTPEPPRGTIVWPRESEIRG
jgi:hypothetical protein